MKKRTLFLGFLLMLALSTAALAADYTDVPADSWARESIDKAAEYGLMNGVGEGRFGLGETISREQFVTILVRMFGWESVSSEDAASTSQIRGRGSLSTPLPPTASLTRAENSARGTPSRAAKWR